MSEDDRGDSDNWRKRAARVAPAIRAAFPIEVFDQDCLRELIKSVSKPTTSRGGAWTGILAKALSYTPPVDKELLDFLKLLQNHDWTQIQWSRNWIVIPILPEAALVYCLPGILYSAIMNYDESHSGIDFVAVEGLITFTLPRLFQERDPLCFFNDEQRHVLADVIHLLDDLTFTDNPQVKKLANVIILSLET